jgi:hypothetical protein
MVDIFCMISRFIHRRRRFSCNIYLPDLLLLVKLILDTPILGSHTYSLKFILLY